MSRVTVETEADDIGRSVDPTDTGAGRRAKEIERGREAAARGAWLEAHRALSSADRGSPLDAAELELLATTAYMLGREGEYFAVAERSHRAHVDAGASLRAARSAFWIGINLAQKGEVGQASGWFARAHRLLERHASECVERGYLLIPAIFQHESAGEWEAAASTASEAAEIAERFADRDLFALAVHEHGHILVRQGRAGEGLPLLDEAMVAATTEELSPIVTGIVYCGVILACQEAHDLPRAKEWTAALTRWCEQQPEMVAFTGRCLLHRAEIMQLGGDWSDAMDEARRANERSVAANNQRAAAEATYRRAEVHRLRGELPEAEQAYRESSARGREPQPGFALLRLAQGRDEAAVGAIRRVIGETTEPAKRARLLPAQVEIMLSTGDVEEARRATRELGEIASAQESTMLDAVSTGARGAVELAEADPTAALADLRRAWRLWEELDAPYEAARARVLVAQACRELGDDDATGLELEAARDTFRQVGAAPDLARVRSLTVGSRAHDHGLTDRELEVLRLVAAGRTNREIADELVISQHTVARHLQNTYAKLGVSSRTAASSFAHDHDLL